jgi:hypothetical protein
MARHYFALFLLLAISFSFAQSFEVNAAPITDLVRVESDLNLTNVIPNYNYERQINVFWAIPDSAITNINTDAIRVYVTAKTDAKGGISFVKAGKQSKESTATLTCFIENGTCSANSTLNATFDVLVAATENGTAGKIDINASMLQQKPVNEIASEATQLVDEIGSKASEYIDGVAQPSAQKPSVQQSAPQKEAPQDAVEFLQQNPLLSLTALAVIVVVTGAYLLKSRD